ncbi:methyltransferase domain-containing protein [Ornithinimicrobium flavum]|uniref:methyltransferase domain-containing protein n=1 Tax=Ornithinimicrobium flavum TaxID=1288636 RepID=UPI00106FBA89|nr:methyltransferase domain-containing protein [Ornithinimicrobium flavum]
MQCDYFDAGRCRSCTLMGVPYAAQLASGQRRVAETLERHVPAEVWLPPVSGPESHFRNKAKLVVGGRKGAPTLGILDDGGRGVDLRHCGLHEEPLHRAILALADLLPGSGLTPYDVPSRQGELKHVLLSVSPDAELMARFVLRSPGQRARVEELLARLRTALPGLRVASINLQPEHKAVLEGPEEVVLTPERTLPMRVGAMTLHLGTRSFFQTNTQVAGALYAQVAQWVAAERPRSVWDLYCGVGGFALACATAAPGWTPDVLGVEVSAEAVASARLGAEQLGLTDHVHFRTGDATAQLDAAAPLDADAGPDPEAGRADPQTLVVNPPRRGIGPRLAGALERSGAATVVYSSCNPSSLATDLSRLPSWRVERARLFDMFPQTSHHEVAVLLHRR